MLMRFQECGWMSWAMLAVGAAGVAAGMIGIALGIFRMRGAALAVSALAAILACVVFAGGFLARAHGRAAVEEVLSLVEGDVAPRLREQGYREAQSCVTVGEASGVAPALVGSAGLVLGFLRRR